MEQETPGGEASSVPDSAAAGEKEESSDTVDHSKMPEHPGRDSDSEGENDGDEQEQ